ncbi:MAG: Wadjet anti-phage system protein JetD domain-containing protein, partial [Spirochaetota bacterium]
MVTPEEIRRKAQRKYHEFLSAYVCGDLFFPLVIRTNKKATDTFLGFSQTIKNLQQQAKEKRGYGYSIAWKKVSKRKYGQQNIPEKIYFSNKEDYLTFIEKQEEFATFQKNLQKIQVLPELLVWAKQQPKKILKYADSWDGILRVCHYFMQNPCPNLYIRELPIAVDTKFIEMHQGILTELLTLLLPGTKNTEEKRFEKRFHLKCHEPLVRFLLLDLKIARESFSGVRDLSIPVSAFASLALPIDTVLVLENKMNYTNIENFLTLPHLEATLAIFGSGFAATALKNSTWLQQINLYYWGDLDIQGLQILAKLREYFPRLESILMDWQTLKTFQNQASQGQMTNRQEPKNLTVEESQVYRYLAANNLRLEQEKLSHSYCKKYLEKLA